MKNIIIVILIAFTFTACSENTSGNAAGSINATDSALTLDETLRGEWMYVHNGRVVYIDEGFEYNITKIDNQLITIDNDGTTYHLMRSGIDITNVSGDIYSDDATANSIARSLSGIGDINLVLKHITDENNQQEQTLEDTGDFNFENVKSGEYTLIATTDTNLSVEADVDVEGEEISLGSFKLVSDDGYNFKTEFIIDNSENGYFYGNMNTYTGNLKIRNIGTIKGTGLNYSFNTDSVYVTSFTNDIVLGTVDVNQSIEIPFSISFSILDKTLETVALDIIIKDVENNEWIDTVFFHVYQTPMNINIVTKEANVKGYIIAPGHDLTQINTGDATIKVPYREGKDYYLVLSNPNIDNETPYSIGIDTTTLSFDSFQETSAHEPNNQESEAYTIKPDESIVSYLHEGDIDYYIIDMSSSSDVGLFSPPAMPFR